MKPCTVAKSLRVVPACVRDYHRLEHFHYRSDKLGVHSAVYALKPAEGVYCGIETAGVIVYTMPSSSVQLRNAALGGMLAGLSRCDALAVVNKNIRCVSRVIIEPRLRGLGLAARLVAETMPLQATAIIEAMAMMGKVNHFFERAGMTAYHGCPAARVQQMREALSFVGIEADHLPDAEFVHRAIERLPREAGKFIDNQMRKFLQSYGSSRRNMPHSRQRTKYILGKLTDRPVYYIWFNPARQIEI